MTTVRPQYQWDVSRTKLSSSEKRELIITAVCEAFEISTFDLKSKAQTQDIARARAAMSYLLRKHAKYTYAKIGMIISRHHTTILHQIRMAEEQIEQREEMMDIIYDIEKLLRAA